MDVGNLFGRGDGGCVCEQEVHRREVDKRRLGREAGKLHQQQQQQRDAVDISDRIRKEREDDRRARQRVKEQIEQDR